ncbi:FYVE, RhoGEF and PH domain-containing protein 6-like [Adelges cooleyi]|uniref:FYVE, RhoGEF and PH domain-containing protein 6-like n=1 Tax=Adelges cooleyi TaxID=133065 RepID=UPI0021809B3D|nr:FYVE, RhoGEF and PH domain-containing protein 6-like [Adelges cooleyi]XP_050425563.1 FYVE, RhoGEF and PH domain-containing protein 6-like [Adelges cooleyi]
MGTPEKIKPPPPPKPILLLTNSDDCSCDERHKVCSKHKMDNPSDNIAVLKCHIDSSATKYTVKPPLLPKPSNIMYKASPYKVKHQFPSVKDQTADENNKTVKSIANRIGGIEIKDDISVLYNEGLKTDSDVNSNISNLEVPVTINSPLENNVIDSENNNVDSITIKCTDNDSDFEFQNESLLNDYVVFDTDMLGVDIQSTIIEDEKSSIASDSTEQSYSVRKKIVNWFGSFGKGKNKKKQRSSFYNSQNESDKEENDTDSHSSMEEKSNEKLDLNESLSIDNIEPGEIISTKTKSLRIVEELISTEKVFIDVLKLLCKTFVTFVEQAGNDFKLIPSNELLKIISPLPQLLSLNEDLLHDMEKRMENWEQHPKIADVIVKKGPFLKLYSTYIQNFEAQCNLLDECCHKYPRFQKCVKEFEASDVCKKLTIKHYMLKPIQRIPQYRMLLESYLKNLDESSIDYKDTSIALNIVCDVANHANKSIKQGDCLSKLLQIQSQLGNYEIIKPGRELVKEGELYKLSRKDMQLRYFILLNDCFLYTSYYGTVTGLKLNYELPLSGMKVFLPLTDDYYNEFNIITITRSFTLRAQTPEEREEWVTTLEEAIRVHNNKQLTFLNMKFIPKNAGCEPLKLGHEAPIWIQDCRVTMCQSCAAEFTVTFRRHHCRACGKVVCRSCSENRAPLHYRKFQSARVCDDCFDYLFKEVEDKIVEVRQTTSNLDETDILYKLDTIKNSFKKSGLWNTKRLVKYVPQRLKEVMANDTGSQISGWLYQRGRKSWKRYWFVLKEQVLYTYKASEDVVALNTVPVLGYSVQTFPEGTNYEDFDSNCVFQLAHAGQRPLIFCADIEQLAKRWINALNEATKLQ